MMRSSEERRLRPPFFIFAVAAVLQADNAALSLHKTAF